jgi:iron(III) transport system ATP-binding protein
MLTSPTAAGATGIRIKNLRKRFASSGSQPSPAAVDDISLEIEPGELFFLLGPSGCGKTTLLRMIAGFIEPTSGSVEFVHDGTATDMTHVAPEQRNTGMVFQSYALWPHMTVFENVAFGLDVRKVGAAERSKLVTEALDAVRMGEYAERKPNQLSGGQQQRVALARAVVIRPSVLLLDEPLSNLDAKLRNELRVEIRRLCKAFGMTTVYVTHDQKEALSMADRIAILKSGRIMQLGTPPELYRRPTTTFVASFLGETNFIRGRITASQGGGFQLVSGKVSIRCAATSSAGVDRPAVISIRPEAIRLHESAAANSLSAKVLDRVYLGESIQYHIDIGADAPLTASVPNPSESLLQAGAAVYVEILPADAVLVND